jgi:hypothetical protein
MGRQLVHLFGRLLHLGHVVVLALPLVEKESIATTGSMPVSCLPV